MKRSESVLVYGVTGILVVILVVAVVFGGGEQQPASPLEERTTTAGIGGDGKATDLTRLASDADAFRDAGGESDPEPAEGADAADLDADQGSTETGEVALRRAAPSTQVVLGPNRRVEQPDGSSFRVVRVRQGDTFSGLVQRFTGSLEMMEEARALNEQLDPARLKAGEEIWLPWVEDEDLFAAHDARGTSLPPRDVERIVPELTSDAGVAVDTAPRTVETERAPFEARRPFSGATSTEAARTGAATTQAAGAIHVVERGESLWRIAEGVVGRARATDYADEIARANGITDATKVKAGQRLVLPPAR